MTDSRYRHAAELLAEGHTRTATAEAVGVSARQLRRWIADDLLPEVGAVGPNGAGHGQDIDGSPPDWTRAEADRRKAVAQARLRELEVRVREGELVERANVRDAFERAGQAARSAPRRLAADAAAVLGCDDREAVRLLEMIVPLVLDQLRRPFEGDGR